MIAIPDTDIFQWDTINMLREKCQGASGPEAFVHELQHKEIMEEFSRCDTTASAKFIVNNADKMEAVI